MDLIRITADKERARSILRMVSLIEERIPLQDTQRMAALILTDYYEIIKDLLTAILLLDGYKTLSHKDLVDYLKERCQGFSQSDIALLDDLRVLMNRVVYDAFFIEHPDTRRNEAHFKKLILALKVRVKGTLG